MGNTPILLLPKMDVDRDPRSYPDRVALESEMGSAFTTLDAFVGHATASLSTRFSYADSAGEMTGSAYTRDDRVILDVVAWSRVAPSTPVTVDVFFQPVGSNFTSIFSASSATNRPVLSGATGTYAARHSQTWTSGSSNPPLWRAGTFLVARTVGAEGSGIALDVEVFWKPTGSYGA